MRLTDFPSGGLSRRFRKSAPLLVHWAVCGSVFWWSGGMTEFDDLSPYSYLPDSVPSGVSVLNVGWLDPGQEFPMGKVPEGFLEKLGALCARHTQARMRGWHSCQLPHPSGAPLYPITIEVGDQPVALGRAEIRVVGRNGAWLAAPDLIYHYVEAHGYLPPEAFIDGVMSDRLPGEVHNQ